MGTVFTILIGVASGLVADKYCTPWGAWFLGIGTGGVVAALGIIDASKSVGLK